MKKVYFFFLYLFFVSGLFAQAKYNFSTPAALSGSPWKSTATIVIDGVTYTLSGGINGDFSNISSGGKDNSPALKKVGSGGDNLIIQRADGKRFQFYGIWLKHSGMSFYPNVPPFYTIRMMNGSSQQKMFMESLESSSRTYIENETVTSVTIMFNALNEYTLDDLIVGPAVPSYESRLSQISLSKGALSPAFSSSLTNYTASVGYSTSALSVRATAMDATGASIKINGLPVATGAMHSVNLQPGNNLISIECTAENGINNSTYTVVIFRNPVPGFCEPASNSTEGDDIRTYILSGEGGGSINDQNTVATINGYDYRNSVPELFMMQGKSYAGTVYTNGDTYMPSDGMHLKIWIDFNNNLVFDEDELIFNGPQLFSKRAGQSLLLAIPESAIPGPHRMRVRAVYEEIYNQTNFTACSDEEYGETHDYNINVLPAVTMPVSLLSFDASNKSGSVLLTWVSVSESNLEKYDIEKSTAGIQFSKVASVAARNTQDRQTYQWTDETMMSSTQYYRLAIKDKNGHTDYSKVVRVSAVENAGSIRVVPNPVTGKVLSLQTRNIEAGNWSVALFDVQGQKVFITNITTSLSASDKQIHLPATVKSGLYRMVLSRNNETYSVSVLIQ